MVLEFSYITSENVVSFSVLLEEEIGSNNVPSLKSMKVTNFNKRIK